jgi:hypothetical protein
VLRPLASARITRTDPGTIDVSPGNTTVSAEDFHRNVLLVLTGTPSGALDLTVRTGKRLFIVQNDCGQDVAVTTGAGAQVVLTSGQRRLLYGDGTNVVAVAPDFASTGGSGGGGGGFPVFEARSSSARATSRSAAGCRPRSTGRARSTTATALPTSVLSRPD